jgi:hypothetical protein
LKIDLPTLMKHRPFQIAWVWEMLCIGVGLYAFLALENDLLFFVSVFAGVIPMVAVVLLFAQARASGVDPASRSRDIVQ